MKARILDATALEAINPAALRAYVIFEGWKKLEPYGQSSEVYERPKNGVKGELIVPFSPNVADYASAVSEVIKFLSRFELRDELEIYNDLIRADRDVIRVRAPDADNDGSIEIDTGVEIVQHARDLLASAACSANEPRRVFHLGKVQKAQDYMRRVRLGQTEHGSYVVTLLAPMPPLLSIDSAQASFWPNLEEEPFERQVTRVLTQALHSAHEAVIESNRGVGLDAFANAVTKGVSANLCDAVAAIIDQANGADISVTWARTRPAPIPRDRIVFTKSDGEVLKEAARQFLLREPRRDERILGYVTHLRRQETEPDGHVTIKAIVDGKARSLSADLSSADYAIASKANVKQLPITLVGDLETTGQRWRLVEPREIRIIEDDDDHP